MKMDLFSEFFSQLLNAVARPLPEGSIFSFFLLVSAVVFLAAEAQQFFKYLSRRRSTPRPARKISRELDPKAPIGWAIAPAFFLILLACVQWKTSEQKALSKNEVPVKRVLQVPQVEAPTKAKPIKATREGT